MAQAKKIIILLIGDEHGTMAEMTLTAISEESTELAYDIRPDVDIQHLSYLLLKLSRECVAITHMRRVRLMRENILNGNKKAPASDI